jgi:hypothetical protein
MLWSLTVLVLTQYPDAVDHLRSDDVVPQVGLILDRSCSMRSGSLHTECSWYGSTYKGGSTYFNKSDQMKSALVGCKSEKDGVLDRWSERVNFSIYEFGSGTTRKAAFDTTLTELETAVMSVPITGGTHMSRALRDHGRYFNQYFNAGNTEVCIPNFLVLLSDGNPNGGDSTFNWECTPPTESRWVGRNEPWRGSDYLWQNPDLLCSVPGDQRISTYTVGFGAPGSFSPYYLQSVADSGAGEYYYASDVEGLNAAFESIISSLQARSALFFAPLAIESGSLFPDNFAYVSSFRPVASGPWVGNLKKFCVLPDILEGGLFDKSDTSCLFLSPDGVELQTNPLSVDLWSGTNSIASDVGGVGREILDRIGAPGAAPPGQPYLRNIVTYRSGESAYVPVTPDEWTEADTFANGCQRYRLINSLHGYSTNTDCATGSPLEVGEWPMGDPVHTNPVFLRYGECNDPDDKPIAGRCYVAQAANDGMLHLFDAATGEETTALVPGELWQPGDVPHSLIADRFDQPGLKYTHRFYVDGKAQLVHRDDDGDYAIDDSELAVLLFSLGRGGRAYYAVDVADLGSDGELEASRNPTYPLGPVPGTAFEQMMSTHSQPWVGRMKVGGETPIVAAFGSGHVPELDFEGASSSPRLGRPPETPGVVVASACDDGFGSGLRPIGFCDNFYTPGCSVADGNCYDNAGVPLDSASVPLTYEDGTHSTRAIRISFDAFDLDPGDTLQVETNTGEVVATYELQEGLEQWTPWVYDDQIMVRLTTDGVDGGHTGYRIGRVEITTGKYREKADPGESDGPGPFPGFVLGEDHQPEVWAVDVERWNGESGPVAFEATAHNAALRLRVTRDCGLGGGVEAGTVCVDQGSSPDLRNMLCPISGEVSAFVDGDGATALYWGDECAQIWKASAVGDGSKWTARRLINLNSGRIGYGPDYRKLFTRLDIVESRCPGAEVVGVYFATGDVQRPAALDLLQDSTITSGHDVVGVVWDDGNSSSNATQADLENATDVDAIDPVKIYAQGRRGWYMELGEQERSIRDPLVADGVAFFRTFAPIPSSQACETSSGVDRIYAVDNCSAEAAFDLDGNGVKSRDEREKWKGSTEGGAGVFIYAPKETGFIVSHGDLSVKQKAEINQRRKRPGLFLWRELE